MTRGLATLPVLVGRAISARRRQLGLTQEQLGERLDLAAKNVQRLESGQNMTLATLDRVAIALAVTPSTLLAPLPAVSEAPIQSLDVERLEAAGFQTRPATQTGRRAASAVPLITIRAAAGLARGPARSVEAIAWVTLPRKAAPPSDQFVAAVEGHSMEPRIPSGALCLFGPPGPPPFGDRIFLVTHSALDGDLDGPFALKRLDVKTLREGKRQITLQSLNPKYPPVALDPRAADDLRVLAVFLEVLVRPDA